MTDRAALVRAALDACRAAAALLEAELSAPVAEPDDPLLDLLEIRALHGVGRIAVSEAIRRGDLRASQGPRRRILVRASEVRRWLESRPMRGHSVPATDGDDPLAAALARGELIATH